MNKIILLLLMFVVFISCKTSIDSAFPDKAFKLYLVETNKIDKLTTHKYYQAVQGANLEFYQKGISPKQRKSSKEDSTDILDKLETFGLIVKK